MDRRAWFRLLAGLSAVALLAMAGVYLYDLGVAHGLAQAARDGAAAVDAPMRGGFRWGFGFFPFFPFLLVLLWVVALRGLFWRGRPWYGRGWCRDGGDGIPPAVEEWHRRAHERQERPPAGANG